MKVLVVGGAGYIGSHMVKMLPKLDAMVGHGIKYFVFSSTVAIFGEPEYSKLEHIIETAWN
jgi:UDP-glucose 4-epimerase